MFLINEKNGCVFGGRAVFGDRRQIPDVIYGETGARFQLFQFTDYTSLFHNVTFPRDKWPLQPTLNPRSCRARSADNAKNPAGALKITLLVYKRALFTYVLDET